jgi:hypothetical protein
MAAATLRPSTRGIPRSVITSRNSRGVPSAAANASMPACPPSAVSSW